MPNIILNTGSFSLSFQNEYIVYENYTYCEIKENDFNLTYNNSASGSLSIPEFVPYVTTVGLYNDNNELLMIGKLAKPIPISSTNDMTFIIRVDV